MKGTLLAFAMSFGVASLAQAPPGDPPACATKQIPGYMTSWSGQPGTKDHSELRSLSKGTHLACFAFGADGSDPACSVTTDSSGHYTVPSREAIRIPHDDNVTLACKGKGATCCEMKMTPDDAPIKKGETKPQPEPQLGIVR